MDLFICNILNLSANEPLQKAPRDEHTNDIHPIKEAPNDAEKDIEDRNDDEGGLPFVGGWHWPIV